MDIHSVRMQMRMKSIYEIPLRVTYYARVSSESDEQLNSLGNQVSYYENFIKKNMPWTFVLVTLTRVCRVFLLRKEKISTE